MFKLTGMMWDNYFTCFFAPVRNSRTTVIVIETSSAIFIERITNKVLVIRIAVFVLRWHGDAEDVKCDLSG
jgi:hypothetical protein